MPVREILYASDTPHFAIEPEDRSAVQAAIEMLLRRDPENPRRRSLMQVCEFLRKPSPPLVSSEDVEAALKLASILSEIEPGEVVDHPWGFIRRTDAGFRVANPHCRDADGVLRSTRNPIELARELYQEHLYSRGLTTTF